LPTLKVIRIVPLLDFGGVEQRIKLTAKGMDQFDDVHFGIIVLGAGGRISNELEIGGQKLWILDRNIKIPNPILIFDLVRLLKKERPDVIHTSGSEANFHGLIAAWITKVPVRVGEEIGFPNHDWKWRLIFRWVYTIATKVIAISAAVKRKILEMGEVVEEKVEVVYNPVEIGNMEIGLIRGGDIGEFQDIHGENYKNTFVFVTSCRLVPVKNLDTLIRVFAEMISKVNGLKTKLWIVGDGPEREKLESLVVHLSITSQVIFWGFQENVTSFLLNADAFVLPSFSEGFSISLVEAMLCGLPCIVTNQGGPPEIIQEGRTGFLIDPNSKFELEQKMEKILFMSKDEREEIGRAAKIDAERYSVENYVDRLVGIYSQLLRENRVDGEN
jgi:glycosyltransferase involved in cell wall biosynthesis